MRTVSKRVSKTAFENGFPMILKGVGGSLASSWPPGAPLEPHGLPWSLLKPPIGIFRAPWRPPWLRRWPGPLSDAEHSLETFCRVFSIIKTFESYTMKYSFDPSRDLRLRLFGRPSKKKKKCFQNAFKGFQRSFEGR